jgi:lipoprotein-anchoring transpeptidase ErfK/SrfK
MVRVSIKAIVILSSVLAGAIGLGSQAMAQDDGALRLASLEPLSLLPEEASQAGEASIEAHGRPIVAMPGDHPAGTILVVNKERRLYLSLGNGEAITYPVAIGKPGKIYRGETRISRKVVNPSWTPTPNIRKANPELPAFVPAGPHNPLGPRALYLGDGYYRIHGTNKPESIGQSASNGCIRMFNADVKHLFALVDVGAEVIIR